MVVWMIEQLEQIALRSLFDSYPYHSALSKHLIAIGRRLKTTKSNLIANWDLLQQEQTFHRFIRMTVILAQNRCYADWISRIRTDADWCFTNCYFASLAEEAQPYFISLYYPRYCWLVLRGMLQSLFSWKPKPEGHALNKYELDFLTLSVEQS